MFLNAIMLVGVGAAVVPLVLHLLSRSRYKDIEWGAMLFLEGADRHLRQSARFTQILLLLMRSVVIALLAIALARPIGQGRWAGQESEGRVTAALLLDCSASMNFDENGRTRFQMAQAAARQIIRGLRPGDRVSLILAGGRNPRAELEPTGDLRAIEARIDEAKVTSSRANLSDAFDLAAEVLGRYEKSARDVYVICDRQALSWQGVDAHFATEWKQRMYGPKLNTRMFVLPVGSTEADNIAVDSVRLINPPAIVGQPADIEVIVRNYGPVQHAAVPITLEGAGLSVPGRSINLAVGQSMPITFSVAFDQPGSQVVTCKIRSAGYVVDDQLDLAVNVIPPIRVLIISGDERQGQFRSESDFPKWALAPHRSAGVPGGDPCSVTVLPAEGWTDTDLAKYQVVMLANVERITPPHARAIEKYVYSGGRLLVAPGSLSRIDDYNTQLYADGAGILPALLQPPTDADGSESTSLLGLQTDHPIFQFLRGRFEIPTATIVRYFPATPRQVDADVLARYLSDDPFLIEGRSEHGRVLLMTTALDADWSTLPLSNFYLPFVQSAVRYLAGDAVTNGNLSPGDAIQLSFDDPGLARTAFLTRPGGKRLKLDIVKRDKQSEFRYADTEEPGRYSVSTEEAGKPTQVQEFVVRAPREESDLTQLREERWQWLERSLGFTRIDPMARPILETLGAHCEGRELWGFILASVFGLCVIEMWVSRRSSIETRGVSKQENLPAMTKHGATWRAALNVE